MAYSVLHFLVEGEALILYVNLRLVLLSMQQCRRWREHDHASCNEQEGGM